MTGWNTAEHTKTESESQQKRNRRNETKLYQCPIKKLFGAEEAFLCVIDLKKIPNGFGFH